MEQMAELLKAMLEKMDANLKEVKEDKNHPRKGGRAIAQAFSRWLPTAAARV
jgi:hypothetical protein